MLYKLNIASSVRCNSFIFHSSSSPSIFWLDHQSCLVHPSEWSWYEIFFFKKWPIRSRRSIIIRLELKFLLWCVSQLSSTNQSEQNKRKKWCPEPLDSAQEPSTTNNKVKIRERNGASNPYVVLKSQATLTTMSLYEHYGLCGMDQFIKTMGQ